MIAIFRPGRAEHQPQRIAPAGLQTERLITPIGPTSIGAAAVDGLIGRNCPAFAPSGPKIPSFCPGVDTQQGLFSRLGGQNGEIIRMKIKASGRLALMVATGLTGLCLCLAAPLPAHAAGSDASASKSDSATDASAQQSSRHGRRHARHQSAKTAEKTADKSESKKAASTAGSVTSAGMPATVANANAELTSGDGNASPAPASVNPMMAASDKPADAQPDSNVVASDQLNDVDRALQQEQPAEPPQPAQPQTAQQEAPAPQPPPVTAAAPKPAPVLASSDSASLDQTSLIGKIFIGFGALLTVASAARMFMA
ncbi:hypothetical protein [Bradyrhizobium tropiciagri]|uniref:hypothetical protein n=1 Tax=Bradyrhizobium tropiciagri TaxID=312253 RepID=UPI0020133BA2|nr:hypothetical protein [Bradyrhizobium tropiciagri]